LRLKTAQKGGRLLTKEEKIQRQVGKKTKNVKSRGKSAKKGVITQTLPKADRAKRKRRGIKGRGRMQKN